MFQSRLGGPALCCEVVPASLRQRPICAHTLWQVPYLWEIISMVILFFSPFVACRDCVLFKNAIKVKC